MGFLDWWNQKNQERASKRVREISYESARTMLISALAYKLKYGSSYIPDLCKAAIFTRPGWEINSQSELVYRGRSTGFFINENTSIADTIEYIVRQEWLSDPFILDMPDPNTLVELGASIAREYALSKMDRFL